ncbi:GrxA family glutaredoxin [Marinobacter sp. V034]|uniref:GrxA family glutaredoxin n=1 Tax=Marinobacter sp. V034 TaxID=3459610 RepID=UPI004044C6AB
MERVTIFGRLSCGFCARAIRLCEMKGFDFKFVDMMEENITKADIAQKIGEPVHTVPQIFVGEAHVGGYTEFASYVASQAAESLS